MSRSQDSSSLSPFLASPRGMITPRTLTRSISYGGEMAGACGLAASRMGLLPCLIVTSITMGAIEAINLMFAASQALGQWTASKCTCRRRETRCETAREYRGALRTAMDEGGPPPTPTRSWSCCFRGGARWRQIGWHDRALAAIRNYWGRGLGVWSRPRLSYVAVPRQRRQLLPCFWPLFPRLDGQMDVTGYATGSVAKTESSSPVGRPHRRNLHLTPCSTAGALSAAQPAPSCFLTLYRMSCAR